MTSLLRVQKEFWVARRWGECCAVLDDKTRIFSACKLDYTIEKQGDAYLMRPGNGYPFGASAPRIRCVPEPEGEERTRIRAEFAPQKVSVVIALIVSAVCLFLMVSFCIYSRSLKGLWVGLFLGLPLLDWALYRWCVHMACKALEDHLLETYYPWKRV